MSFPYTTSSLQYQVFLPLMVRSTCFPLVSHLSPGMMHALNKPTRLCSQSVHDKAAIQVIVQRKHEQKATKRPTVRIKKRRKVTITVPKKAQRRRVISHITPVWMDPSFGCAAWNGPLRPCGAWSSGGTARRGLSMVDIAGTSLNWGAMKPLPPAP